MSSVIDFGEALDRRDGPANDCLARDQYGRRLHRFMLAYELDGRDYTFDIWAHDFAEAERHAEAIRDTVTVSGQIYERGDL